MKAHAIPMLAVATYIERMRRSLVSRITAFAIATVVGFASPALALTHGYAHHEHQGYPQRAANPFPVRVHCELGAPGTAPP